MTSASARALASLVVAVLLVTGAVLFVSAAPASAATPVIVLSSFRTAPSTLVAGQRFRLAVMLDNVSDTPANNVVVTLGASTIPSASAMPSETPQVVVLGSNTKYVGTIDALAKGRSVGFDLASNPRSAPGPFNLPVRIEFDSTDASGTLTRAAVDQSVGLIMTRTLVFDVGALTYPRQTAAGAPFQVSVSVKNTNDFPVNGVTLSFASADATLTSAEETVGVLAPGQEATLTATGTTVKPGSATVTMVLQYKDDFNATKQIRRDLTIAVAPAPAAAPVRQKAPSGSAGAKVVRFLEAFLGLGG